MYPAPSVILFSTLSGAGYGLAIVLCLGGIPASTNTGIDIVKLMGWACAGSFVSIGLIASMYHLRHPERFVLALKQWRSSWLSREGVLATFGYLPLGAIAFMEVFTGGAPVWLKSIGALIALATVLCTSMIYRSIAAVHAWANSMTPMLFLSSSLSSGLLIAGIFAVGRGGPSQINLMMTAAIVVALTWVYTFMYWRKVDALSNTSQGKDSMPSIETATGLGSMGRVTVLDQPHMNSNYLLNEMGFRIARKHALKLRTIAVCVGLMLAYVAIGGAIVAVKLIDVLPSVLLLIASVGHLSGIGIARWLFFAQARHTSMLYYGHSQSQD